ncbi:pyrin [Lates japonicus]|uniref:Pyrin n=1 Tax=Lates japonicus TaxID=270547 RepID=A0AAD3RCS3_LATJO|nr:pyrin [Lates japonicus]
MEVLAGCKPIPRSRLENSSRRETVSRMTETYGEESAVRITVTILRKIRIMDEAEKLERTYAAEVGKPAAPSSSSSSASAPPAAPASLSAQQGSVIIAPTVTGGTSGSWNITINK